MLSVNLDETSGIAVLEPDGPLAKADFERAASIIDPYIEKHGKLNGLVIHVESFPGWDSFAALASHLRFVHDHHRHIRRVALATDSMVGNLAEKLAGHFINAEIRLFAFRELQQAKDWINGPASST